MLTTLTSNFATITAPITSMAPAGVALIRISGSKVKDALNSIFVSKQKQYASPIDYPRTLVYGDFINSEKEKIDSGLAVFMPGPNSYTGEDTAELHLHGSPFVVEKLISEIYKYGIVPAGPGEFTKRAFLNGKLDLVQAEGVADVINSATDLALKNANNHLDGKFSSQMKELTNEIKKALALLEANLDFTEHDVDDVDTKEIQENLLNLRARIEKIIASFNYAQVVKDGYKVLIYGKPNVGKSSLLNSILNRERAIVTPISGTTRDLIEEAVNIDGYKFIFCDTAGIVETDNDVERIGIELANKRLTWADLILLILDPQNINEGLSLLSHANLSNKDYFLILNKTDLLSSEEYKNIVNDFPNIKFISAKTGDGIAELKNLLIEKVKHVALPFNENDAIVTTQRQKKLLMDSISYLDEAIDSAKKNLPLEMIGTSLRSALLSFSSITGESYTEDILENIFSQFCIGK